MIEEIKSRIITESENILKFAKAQREALVEAFVHDSSYTSHNVPEGYIKDALKALDDKMFYFSSEIWEGKDRFLKDKIDTEDWTDEQHDLANDLIKEGEIQAKFEALKIIMGL